MVQQPPRALAAFPPFALELAERVLANDLELVPVKTMADAVNALAAHSDFRVVLCGVHFDESRMYDLLQHVRTAYPALPFLCCRILDSEIPRISREAIRIAAESLGATFFIDLPALAKDLGAQDAERRFRTLVLGMLGVRLAGDHAR